MSDSENLFRVTKHINISKMKINEVTEAPVSGIKQAATRLGAKAAGALGMKDVSANLKGKTNLARTANNLYNEFARYLGGQGKCIKQATGRDLKAFLDKKNVDTTGIANGPIDSDRLNSVLLQKSREAIAGRGGKKITPPKQSEPVKVSSAYAQTKQAALKLNAKEKRRLADQLLKSIKQGKPPVPTFIPRRGQSTP